MSELVRTNQDDQTWRKQLHTFIKSASVRHQPLLIEYLYEDPLTVPQRLYRYDVFDDYLTRLRDDFEFGYDLITACSRIAGRRTYGVYVIELDGNSNHVYVGQTWYMPEERLRQHLTGYAVFHAARPFKRGAGGKLRPDLYEHLPRYATQQQAEDKEASWALELRKAGYRVEGGH
jgi:hypothetical protein